MFHSNRVFLGSRPFSPTNPTPGKSPTSTPIITAPNPQQRGGSLIQIQVTHPPTNFSNPSSATSAVEGKHSIAVAGSERHTCLMKIYDIWGCWLWVMIYKLGRNMLITQRISDESVTCDHKKAHEPFNLPLQLHWHPGYLFGVATEGWHITTSPLHDFTKRLLRRAGTWPNLVGFRIGKFVQPHFGHSDFIQSLIICIKFMKSCACLAYNKWYIVNG